MSLSFGVARNRQTLPVKERETATNLVQNVPNLSKKTPAIMALKDVKLEAIAKIEFSSDFCSVSLFSSLIRTLYLFQLLYKSL